MFGILSSTLFILFLFFIRLIDSSYDVTSPFYSTLRLYPFPHLRQTIAVSRFTEAGGRVPCIETTKFMVSSEQWSAQIIDCQEIYKQSVRHLPEAGRKSERGGIAPLQSVRHLPGASRESERGDIAPLCCTNKNKWLYMDPRQYQVTHRTLKQPAGK